MSTQKILRVDASARVENSVTRDLADRIIARFPEAEVTARDLRHGVPLIDEAWIGANFTPADDRSDAQREVLARSDAYVAEVQEADILVLGVPIYNFSVPAALKAWIDQIARAEVTFRYTADGPKGLLEGKSAIVALASGGTEMDSDIDFAGRYIRHVLGFIGITEVTFVRADRMAVDAAGTLARAHDAVDRLAA
jgi:FMN-dependent NADH-azoreductase